MKVRVLKLAEQEFYDARDFYEVEQHGLGIRFEKEIKSALLRIARNPSIWPFEAKDIHRYFVHKFPYKILFSVQDDHLIVLAFAHHHRKPDYWVNRL